jgi:hypothetical protein
VKTRGKKNAKEKMLLCMILDLNNATNGLHTHGCHQSITSSNAIISSIIES